jgi:hypothetical protein
VIFIVRASEPLISADHFCQRPQRGIIYNILHHIQTTEKRDLYTAPRPCTMAAGAVLDGMLTIQVGELFYFHGAWRSCTLRGIASDLACERLVCV